MNQHSSVSYVSEAVLPPEPPPLAERGAVAWFRENLFSSPFNTIATLLSLAFIAWAVPPLLNWLIFNATWTADNREGCLIAAGGEPGACWAFVKAKLGQFIYGRYPGPERWRVDLVFFLLAAGLIPLAIPKVPYKKLNAIFLLGVFPVLTLVLLTGGNFSFSPTTNVVLLALLAGALISSMNSTPESAAQEGLTKSAALVLALGVAGFVVAGILSLILPSGTLVFFVGTNRVSLGALLLAAASVIALGLVAVDLVRDVAAGRRLSLVPAVVLPVSLLLAYLALTLDFGLSYVETPQWGGLMLTMVIAVVGIVASLPLGILLALGRRSDMPVIRTFCIVFIEFWRGVPLITVLFMASVMLPLFLPAGVNFDKLMRALIGVTLFSAAYMAEVIRGGLQAIPIGQYEGASAMGLSYWPAMRLVILPQALRVVIPGIVNSFISLFKDTSLVLIIGLFDLLGIIQQNFADPNWASPVTPATGFAFAALIYWTFCFGMSRYSLFIEKRLNTAHRN
jgi:general L-amino acid transport system permease protein